MDWRSPVTVRRFYLSLQHVMVVQVAEPCRTRRVKEGLCGSAALRPADPIPRGPGLNPTVAPARPVPVLSEPGRNVDKAPQLRLGSGCRITRADRETLRQEQ